MKRFVFFLMMMVLLSCNKVVEVSLPEYEAEMAVEMYLEEGNSLKCLLSESLPYTSLAIEKPLREALVIFSDGKSSDTLLHTRIDDWETGRWYNYSHPRIFFGDSSKTYTLTVTDGRNRKLTATTRLSQREIKIDNIVTRPSLENKDKFSVGMVITDPPAEGDYYRFLIARSFNDYTSDVTDLYLPDISFNGHEYSLYSDAVYTRNDTVMVRVYSIPEEHYNYLQTANNARRANFNPFVQPSPVHSNITDGLGIFTILRYDERRIVVK